jgi:transcriptional regulator with XRE-family HTH domain
MTPLKNVGARVAELRAKRSMTQETLAAKARLNRASLANIERGAKQPKLDTLERLAKALKVSLAVLLK